MEAIARDMKEWGLRGQFIDLVSFAMVIVPGPRRKRNQMKTKEIQ